MKYILKPDYRHKDAMWIMLDGLIWSSCAPTSSPLVAQALRNQRTEPVTVTAWLTSWEVRPESPNTRFCDKK